VSLCLCPSVLPLDCSTRRALASVSKHGEDREPTACEG
jgi:hypothetical protein